jgi:hypothetical protein
VCDCGGVERSRSWKKESFAAEDFGRTTRAGVDSRIMVEFFARGEHVFLGGEKWGKQDFISSMVSSLVDLACSRSR